MTHECNICGKSFTRVDSLSRHVKSLHSDENNLEFENEMLGSGKEKEFRRPSWKTPPSHHMLTPSNPSLNDAHYSCYKCEMVFPSRFMLEKHLKQNKSHRKSAEDIIKENSFMQRAKSAADKIFEKRQM